MKFRSAAEGGAFTLSIKREATADIAKMKFKEANYSIGLDWAVFKGRAAELTLAGSVQPPTTASSPSKPKRPSRVDRASR